MARKGQMIRADLSQVGEALGIVNGISVYTNRNAGDLAGHAARHAQQKIGEILDEQALANPKLSHMYEYNMRGLKAGRLFDIRVISSGANRRSRTIVWTPRIAKVYGPSLADRINSGRLNLDIESRVFKPGKKTGNAVSLTKRYIFYQKAAMMEFGKVANIKPRKADGKIFVPLENPHDPDRPFVFLDKARVNFRDSGHAGQFNIAWLHASGVASAGAVREIETVVNRSTRNSAVKIGMHTSKKDMELAFRGAQEQTKRQMARDVNARMKRAYVRDDG